LYWFFCYSSTIAADYCCGCRWSHIHLHNVSIHALCIITWKQCSEIAYSQHIPVNFMDNIYKLTNKNFKNYRYPVAALNRQICKDMYMCLNKSIYVYKYIFIHTYIYICIYIYIHTYTYVYTYMNMYVYIYVHIHM